MWFPKIMSRDIFRIQGRAYLYLWISPIKDELSTMSVFWNALGFRQKWFSGELHMDQSIFKLATTYLSLEDGGTWNEVVCKSIGVAYGFIVVCFEQIWFEYV